MKTEIWKDVVGYEGVYKVSNFGFVKSLARETISKDGKRMPIKEKILVGASIRYKFVLLYKDNKSIRKTRSIHRIVAMAFIPNPKNLAQVNHIDGDRYNNNVENLEWCDAFHNMQHCYRLGLRKTMRSGETKVWNPNTGESFQSIRKLSEHLNIKYQTLYSKITGPQKNDTGFEYMDKTTPVRKRAKVNGRWITIVK